MVMKNRVIYTKGIQTNTRVNSLGTTIASSLVNARTEVLTSVLSVNGPRTENHPHSYKKTIKSHWHGYHHTDSVSGSTKNYIDGILDNVNDPLLADLAFSSAAFNDALEKLHDQLRGDVDLSIDILQSPQAKSMVTSWAKGAKSLITTIRKIKRMPLKAASSAYLQWSYGVKPTLSTIFGAMEEFSRTAVGPIKIKTRGFASEHKTVKVLLSTYGITIPMDLLASYRCQIIATYTKPNSTIANIGNYTSLNPASITYEMIPFSFVVDWFYNIGGWIRGLESAYILSPFLSNVLVSQGLKMSQIGRLNGSGMSGPTTRISWNVEGGVEVTAFSREKRSNLLLPKKPVFPKLDSLGRTSVSRTLQGLALSRSSAKSLDKSILFR